MIEQILKVNPFPDGHSNLLKTDDVSRVLTYENYQFFLGPEVSRKVYWLEQEKLVVLVYREPTVDVKGRQGELRHILLIPILDYLQETDPLEHFSRYFLSGLKEDPKTLNPISLESQPENVDEK